GKFLQDAPTLQNLDRSVLMLKRALQLDPQYAAAHGSLASAYLWYVDTGLRPDPEYLSKAEEAAQKALAIDKGQPDALYTLANLTMKRGQVETAFDEFSKVLEADPNHGYARWWRAILLYYSSFLEEALQEADRLLAVDPFWPMAHWLHSTVRLHQGMFDAAVAEYEQMVAEVPSKLVWLALAYRYVGKMDKAWEAAQKVRELEPEGILWPIAYAFLEGAEGRGKEILEYVDERVKAFAWDFLIVTYWVASFYAMAEEKDEAFRWLERGIAIGNRNYRWFEVDPNMDNLRGDPHFEEVLRKARSEALKLETLWIQDR
ncbi:MAG: tetratricopeptide repeat protein, partial [bacterium]